MTKKEVINVMSKFDFTNERITTTGDTFQVGFWDYAKKNKKIYPTIKTKYIKIKKYKDISSSLVKDLLVSSGDLELNNSLNVNNSSFVKVIITGFSVPSFATAR